MSIQVNIGDHVSPVAGYVAVPPFHRATTNWARARAKVIARDLPSANTYFQRLPGRRTLSQLLADRTIWINYAPGIAYFGEAIVSGKELAIGPSAYRLGRWSVLATLIHELAHIDGAPGGASSAAEEALVHCGLGRSQERATGVDDPKTPYQPGIQG